MNEFLQQLINGLAVGGIYALVALGYTMVYGVLKLINFAHGDIFTIGAYLGMTLLVSGGLAGSMTPVLAVGLVVLIVFGLVALLGVALERVAYRPLRKANRLAAVVSARGASIVFQNAVMLIYGARVYVYPENLIPTLTFNIFGLNVPVMRVIVIVSSLVLMLALYAFINRTRMGTAIRAVAIDQGAARLMGINVDRVISLVFFIGAGLGGVAGVMVGTYYGQIDFTMVLRPQGVHGGHPRRHREHPRSHDRRAAARRDRGARRVVPRHGMEGRHCLPRAHPHPHHQAHRPPR